VLCSKVPQMAVAISPNNNNDNNNDNDSAKEQPLRLILSSEPPLKKLKTVYGEEKMSDDNVDRFAPSAINGKQVRSDVLFLRCWCLPCL
jgi:hypothetical protein